MCWDKKRFKFSLEELKVFQWGGDKYGGTIGGLTPKHQFVWHWVKCLPKRRVRKHLNKQNGVPSNRGAKTKALSERQQIGKLEGFEKGAKVKGQKLAYRCDQLRLTYRAIRPILYCTNRSLVFYVVNDQLSPAWKQQRRDARSGQLWVFRKEDTVARVAEPLEGLYFPAASNSIQNERGNPMESF